MLGYFTWLSTIVRSQCPQAPFRLGTTRIAKTACVLGWTSITMPWSLNVCPHFYPILTPNFSLFKNLTYSVGLTFQVEIPGNSSMFDTKIAFWPAWAVRKFPPNPSWMTLHTANRRYEIIFLSMAFGPPSVYLFSLSLAISRRHLSIIIFLSISSSFLPDQALSRAPSDIWLGGGMTVTGRSEPLNNSEKVGGLLQTFETNSKMIIEHILTVWL